MSVERAAARTAGIAEVAPSRSEAAETLGDLRFRADEAALDLARDGCQRLLAAQRSVLGLKNP